MKNKSLKVILFAVLVAFMVSSCSTTSSDEPVQKEMQIVIEAPDKTQDELYVLANSWAVDTFKSSEAVIDFSDKEAGIIKGTFTYEIGGFNTYMTETTMTIEVKEGRLRMTFDNAKSRMTHLMGNVTSLSAWPWGECSDGQLAELNKVWSLMIQDLSNALNEETEVW